MYIFNFSNQIGAGPRAIAKAMVEEVRNWGVDYEVWLPDSEFFRCYRESSIRSRIAFFPTNVIFRHLFLLGAQLRVLLVHRKVLVKVVSFGNFPLFFFGKQVVLVHHPYLFDSINLNKLDFRSRVWEKFKRIIFRLSIRRETTYVAQSSYVADELLKIYHLNSSIIPNPITADFAINAPPKSYKGGPLRLIYPSRYYPHKNHRLLFSLVSAARVSKLPPFEIYVTVDPELPGADKFLALCDAYPEICNLGEVEKSRLSLFYSKSDIFIFLSESETFGNPIAEATFFKIPLLLPNRPYARIIADDKAAYFELDDPSSFIAAIEKIICRYDMYSSLSTALSSSFLQSSEWSQRYRNIVG